MRANVVLPVKARARRTANIVASVPDAVNRTRSIEGNRSDSIDASSTSRSDISPCPMPLASCSWTPLTTAGCACPSGSELKPFAISRMALPSTS